MKTLAFEKTWRVRYCECDGYGHLQQANYLRYITETFLEALAAFGINRQDPGSQAYAWHASEVYLDYQASCTYQDPVRVVAVFRGWDPTDLKWTFDLCNPETGRNYLQARLKYGLMDLVRQEWIDLPEEITARIGSQEVVDQVFPSINYPITPPPPAGTYRRPWQVAWRDTAPNQTIHLAGYLDFLLEFVLEAARACNWSIERANADGFSSVIRRQWLKIYQPAKYEEEMALATWLSAMKSSSVTRHFSIHRAVDQELLGVAHTLWVCIDPASGRPVRIPEAWKQDFAPQLAGG